MHAYTRNACPTHIVYIKNTIIDYDALSRFYSNIMLMFILIIQLK